MVRRPGAESAASAPRTRYNRGFGMGGLGPRLLGIRRATGGRLMR